MYHAPVNLDLEEQEPEPADVADDGVGSDASSNRLREAHLHNGQAQTRALFAPFFSATAFGADPGTDKSDSKNALPDFSTLDANGDGAISNDESREQSWVASRFGELDGDKNGKLSKDEYQKAVELSKPPNPQ